MTSAAEISRFDRPRAISAVTSRSRRDSAGPGPGRAGRRPSSPRGRSTASSADSARPAAQRTPRPGRRAAAGPPPCHAPATPDRPGPAGHRSPQQRRARREDLGRPVRPARGRGRPASPARHSADPWVLPSSRWSARLCAKYDGPPGGPGGPAAPARACAGRRRSRRAAQFPPQLQALRVQRGGAVRSPASRARSPEDVERAGTRSFSPCRRNCARLSSNTAPAAAYSPRW